MKKEMRSEMVYISVRVELRYAKGFRKDAVTAAKNMLAIASKSSAGRGSEYFIQCKGNIRERKAKWPPITA